MSLTLSKNFDRHAVDSSAQRAVARLASVLRGARSYPLNHPALRSSLEGFTQAASELYHQIGPTELRIHDEMLLVGDHAVRSSPGAKKATQQLVGVLQALDAGGISLSAEPHIDEVIGFCEGLLERGEGQQSGDMQSVAPWLVERGVRSLGLVPLDLQQTRSWKAHEVTPALASLTAYLRAIRAIQQLYTHGLEPGVVVLLTRASQGLVEVVDQWPARACVLASPRHQLPYEIRHPVHVALISTLIGQRLGMGRGELLELALCSFAIDCGMATIPEHIRKKTDPLTPKERALIEAHPIESVKALLAAPSLTPSVRRRVLVAFESHLGVDAGGYPSPMRWEEVHLFTRIVSLADGYDALRAETAYRKAKTVSAAISVLRQQAGKRYDPALLAVLERLVKDAEYTLDHGDDRSAR